MQDPPGHSGGTGALLRQASPENRGGDKQMQAERLVKAAEKVSRHQYETMKAAVAIVGIVKGWK